MQMTGTPALDPSILAIIQRRQATKPLDPVPPQDVTNNTTSSIIPAAESTTTAGSMEETEEKTEAHSTSVPSVMPMSDAEIMKALPFRAVYESMGIKLLAEPGSSVWTSATSISGSPAFLNLSTGFYSDRGLGPYIGPFEFGFQYGPYKNYADSRLALEKIAREGITDPQKMPMFSLTQKWKSASSPQHEDNTSARQKSDDPVVKRETRDIPAAPKEETSSIGDVKKHDDNTSARQKSDEQCPFDDNREEENDIGTLRMKIQEYFQAKERLEQIEADIRSMMYFGGTSKASQMEFQEKYLTEPIDKLFIAGLPIDGKVKAKIMSAEILTVARLMQHCVDGNLAAVAKITKSQANGICELMERLVTARENR